MSTTLTTKRIDEGSSRDNARMLGAFYLLTFLTGGLFMLAGGKLGFIVDLVVAMFYIAVTLLFYVLNKAPQGPTVN